MGKRRRTRLDTVTEHTATVESLSHDGRGIARIDGKTTFLFNALPTETVRFRYTKKRGQYDEGASTDIIEPADNRQTPICPHFSLCGGCSLQHLSGEDQLAIKTAAALNLLEQQNIRPKHMLPALASTPKGYRRKARIGAKFLIKKSKMLVGFRERGRSLVADLSECHVLDSRIGLQLKKIKAVLDTLEAKCHIPQLEIAATEDTAALIIRHMIPLCEADIAAIKKMAVELNFRIYLQSKGIDSITLLYPENVDDLLHYRLPEYNLSIAFHPSQFTQINEDINQKMIQQALRLLDCQPHEQVLDLFCGVGNFSLPLAKQVHAVTGIEGDNSAVQRAEQNATLNNIKNTTFITANLFEDCSHLPFTQQTFDKVLLDPPRSGAKEILPQLKTWQPKSIVYVSCNPATFARDASILEALGYTLDSLGVMDMFPHTKHVEVMGLFHARHTSHQ